MRGGKPRVGAGARPSVCVAERSEGDTPIGRLGTDAGPGTAGSEADEERKDRECTATIEAKLYRAVYFTGTARKLFK